MAPNIMTMMQHQHLHQVVLEEDWRKYGRERRNKLLEKDIRTGGAYIAISKSYRIQQYFEVAGRVLAQFRILYQNRCNSNNNNELEELFVMGNRIVVFLGETICKHPAYRANVPMIRNLREKSLEDLDWVRKRVDAVAFRIDESHFNRRILRDLRATKQKQEGNDALALNTTSTSTALQQQQQQRQEKEDWETFTGWDSASCNASTEDEWQLGAKDVCFTNQIIMRPTSKLPKPICDSPPRSHGNNRARHLTPKTVENESKIDTVDSFELELELELDLEPDLIQEEEKEDVPDDERLSDVSDRSRKMNRKDKQSFPKDAQMPMTSLSIVKKRKKERFSPPNHPKMRPRLEEQSAGETRLTQSHGILNTTRRRYGVLSGPHHLKGKLPSRRVHFNDKLNETKLYVPEEEESFDYYDDDDDDDEDDEWDFDDDEDDEDDFESQSPFGYLVSTLTMR